MSLVWFVHSTRTRVHIGHTVKSRLSAQLAHNRIVLVNQSIDVTLHEPLSHGLSRMLTRDCPHFQRATACR